MRCLPPSQQLATTPCGSRRPIPYVSQESFSSRDVHGAALSVDVSVSLSGVHETLNLRLADLWRTYLPMAIWMLRQTGSDPYWQSQEGKTSSVPPPVSPIRPASPGASKTATQKRRVMIGLCGPAGSGKTFLAQVLRIVVNAYHAVGTARLGASGATGDSEGEAAPSTSSAGPAVGRPHSSHPDHGDVCVAVSMDAYHYPNARLEATPLAVQCGASEEALQAGADHEPSDEADLAASGHAQRVAAGDEGRDAGSGSRPAAAAGSGTFASSSSTSSSPSSLRRYKGRLDTIDAPAFAADLVRVSQSVATDVTLPEYDRGVHDPVPGRVLVQPCHRVVIVEGLYLLVGAGEAENDVDNGYDDGDGDEEMKQTSTNEDGVTPGSAESGAAQSGHEGSTAAHSSQSTAPVPLLGSGSAYRRQWGKVWRQLDGVVYLAVPEAIRRARVVRRKAGGGRRVMDAEYHYLRVDLPTGMALESTGLALADAVVEQDGSGNAVRAVRVQQGLPGTGAEAVVSRDGSVTSDAVGVTSGSGRGVLFLGPSPALQRQMLLHPGSNGHFGSESHQPQQQVRRAQWKGLQVGGKGQNAAAALASVPDLAQSAGLVTAMQPLGGLAGEQALRILGKTKGLQVVVPGATDRATDVDAGAVCDEWETRTCVTVLEATQAGRGKAKAGNRNRSDGALRVTELVEESAPMPREHVKLLSEAAVAACTGGDEKDEGGSMRRPPSVLALCGSVPTGCQGLYQEVCEAVAEHRRRRASPLASKGTHYIHPPVDWVVMDSKGQAAEESLWTGAVDAIKCNFEELCSLAGDATARIMASRHSGSFEGSAAAGKAPATGAGSPPTAGTGPAPPSADTSAAATVRAALGLGPDASGALGGGASRLDHAKECANALHRRHGVKLVAVTDGPRSAYLFQFENATSGSADGEASAPRTTVFRMPTLGVLLQAARDLAGTGTGAGGAVLDLGAGEEAARKALGDAMAGSASGGGKHGAPAAADVPCGSPIGAGDAVCGVMCGALAAGLGAVDAFRLGLAAGCASCLRVEMGNVGSVELRAALDLVRAVAWKETVVDGSGL